MSKERKRYRNLILGLMRLASIQELRGLYQFASAYLGVREEVRE